MTEQPDKLVERLTRIADGDGPLSAELREIATSIPALLSQAREDALEEAAKIADEEADNASDASVEYDGGSGSCGYRMACARIELAIRSLSGKGR